MSIHTTALIGFVAASLMMCSSCSRQETPVEPEHVVARIGDRFITLGDLEAEAGHHQQRGRAVSSKEQLLEDLVTHESLVLRAKREQLAEDPAIRREIERLLVTRLRGRALTDKLKSVEVSEEETEAEYLRRIEQYTRPALDRFAALFLRVERKASDLKKEAVRGRMEEARRMAAQQSAESGFGKLAVNYSDDQVSRYRGGDIGWVAANKSTSRLPESVLDVGRTLSPGTLSDIIQTDDGLYLVMKTDSRPSSITGYGQVRDSLRKSLLAEERRLIEEHYLRECVDLADPQIDEVVLGKFELNSGPQTESADSGPALAGGLLDVVQ